MNKIKLSDYGFNILQIETSANCNMACSFCPYPLKDDFSSKLDLNEIKNIIHQINNNDKNLIIQINQCQTTVLILFL